jgi:hypothetical protein
METKRIAALRRATLFGSLTSEELADVAQRAIEIEGTSDSASIKGIYRYAASIGACPPAERRQEGHQV